MREKEKPVSVAISPCPNDTFAFFGLTQDPLYNLAFHDIEELNLQLKRQEFLISKGSFALLEEIGQNYSILETGAAIGNGVGPVLVGRVFEGARIALPGENTTANRLFRYWKKSAHPQLEVQTEQMPFYEILPALTKGVLDAAVLIHEGRFVYERMGLPLVVDLGSWYEKTTGAMIPLGCIYAHNDLSTSEKQTFVLSLQKSLTQSVKAYKEKSHFYKEAILPFMRRWAQENEDAVIEAHVDTYVTADTEKLSDKAIASIAVFRKKCLTLDNSQNFAT